MWGFAEFGFRVIFKGLFKAIVALVCFLGCAGAGFVQIFLCGQWQKLLRFLIILFVSFTVLSHIVPRTELFGGPLKATVVNVSVLLSSPMYLFLVYKKGEIK